MYVIYEEDYDVKIIGYVETREEALIYCAINKQYSFDGLPKIEDIDINTKLEYRHAIRFIKTDSGWDMQNLISCGFAPNDKDNLEDTEYSRGNLYISSSDRILMKIGKRGRRKHRYISLMYEAPAYDRDIADLAASCLFEQ